MPAGIDLQKHQPATCRAKKNWMQFIFATLIFSLMFGCGKKPQQTPVRLYAGAGMRHAVEALSTAFEQQSGIAVEADYAGSGTLITRAQGDPAADLFMPGDIWYVDRLHEKTRNIEESLTVSFFVPTLIVPKGNPKGIRSVGNLTNQTLRVALGNPEACQIGRISVRILKNAGVEFEDLHAMESMTVNELGIWVKMNHADVAIVWDAIAMNISESVEIIKIPMEINEISTVVCGLLNSSSNKEAARRFMQFMAGPQGKAILKEKGYRVEWSP